MLRSRPIHHGWTQDPGKILAVSESFRLTDVDADATPGFQGGKAAGEEALALGLAALGDLQERLFASYRVGEASESVLLVLQGMDTAGKGGIVRHVVGGIDPQGVRIAGFRAPTEEELAHDFLWRITPHVPQPGFIGVFDRSHYEDVLIGKVRHLAPPAEIERRYAAIREFEEHLTNEGVRIVKVMLHISREEQFARLSERLENPEKYWKYEPGDIDERLLWDEYMTAYETALTRTSTETAPWWVVPANAKWYARLAVQELLLDALEAISPQWPDAPFDIDTERRRLAESR